MRGLLARSKQMLLDRGPSRLVMKELVRRELQHGEPELSVVPFLCSEDAGTVDVGANRGVYSHVAMPRSRSVTAIEANPDLAAFIRRWSRGRVDVRQTAVSDSVGTGRLVTPVHGGRSMDGLSSLEPVAEGDDEYQVREVPVTTLDALQLPACGFLKVDVEGHEFEVLAGAREMLQRDRPLLQVEIEERHRAGSLASCLDLLAAMDYSGFFLRDGSIRALSEFRQSVDQDATAVVAGSRVPGRVYINNFYFAQPGRQTERLCDAVERAYG